MSLTSVTKMQTGLLARPVPRYAMQISSPGRRCSDTHSTCCCPDFVLRMPLTTSEGGHAPL